MLDGVLFDKLNEIGMTVRNNTKPFGGIQARLSSLPRLFPLPFSLLTSFSVRTQIVGVGDFFQLPPVPDKGSKATFAFQAKSWDAAIPRVVVLNHVFRQKDDRQSFLSSSSILYQTYTDLCSSFSAIDQASSTS